MTEYRDISINGLLQALSAEIAEMSLLSERLQTILVLASARPDNQASLYRDIQSCDLLTQKLTETAKFLTVIAKEVPVDWAIDANVAISDLGLSDLAQAYSLSPRSERANIVGLVELF